MFEITIGLLLCTYAILALAAIVLFKTGRLTSPGELLILLAIGLSASIGYAHGTIPMISMLCALLIMAVAYFLFRKRMLMTPGGAAALVLVTCACLYLEYWVGTI